MKTIPFFKGLSWLIVLNLLIKPLWIFFIYRKVQNIVGYEEYGKYFAILNLSYILFFLSDAGLSNLMNQKLANHLQVHVLQFIRIKFFLLASYIIVCCFAAWLTHVSNLSVLLYVIFIQALTSVFVFFRSIITANQLFTVDAWFSIIDKFLMTFICGGIIYTSFFGTFSLLWFLKIQTVSTGLAVLVSFLFILKKRWIVLATKDDVGKIVKQILPFAVIILLMSIHYRLDGFLLERMYLHGALETGIYASAYRLLDAGNMIGYLAASFLVPFTAKHLAEKRVIEETIITTRHVMIFFSIGIACFTLVFAPWVERILYHSDNSYHSKVIALCVAALPAYYLVHIYGSMLTAASQFNQFITVLILSVVINIVLNILLIPAYGAIGCCVAALISQYFCGMACCVTATKAFSISYHFKSVFTYVLSAALLLLIFYFGRISFVNIGFILIIAVSIILFFVIMQISFFKKYFIILR